MVHPVTPIEECPMCGEENIKLVNSCPINNPDHKICKSCVQNLKKKYNKQFCAYCGERPVIINIPITVNPRQNSINIVIENRSTITQSEAICQYWGGIFLTLIVLVSLFITLNLNWHLFKMIHFYITYARALDEEIHWSLLNAFYALFLDICLFMACISALNND
jgi:predicted RNA-binding Zn-ribbon protein involved in translation (DUF1610 family)